MLQILKKQVGVVWLILGTSCNCNCSYCVEHPLITCKQDMQVNPKVYEFIKETHPLKILFYGGEPLLYYDTIKQVVNTIRHEWGWDDNSIKISTMTNGKLLDEDKINFLNANDVKVNVSWDGVYSQKTRGYDAVKDKYGLLFKIKRLCLHSTMTAYSYPFDFFYAQKEFDDVYYSIHGKHIQIDFDVVKNCANSADDVYRLDPDRIYREFKQIIKDADSIPLFKTFVDNRLERIDRFYTVYDGKLSYKNRLCTTGIYNYNLGVDGRFYSCHNADVVIGDMDTPYEEYIQNLLDNDNSQEQMKKCAECSCVSMCGGLCSVNAKEWIETNCSYKMAMSMPFIERALELGIIKEVEAHD